MCRDAIISKARDDRRKEERVGIDRHQYEEEVDAHQDSVDVENGHADLRSVSDDVQEMLSARMKTRNLQQPS